MPDSLPTAKKAPSLSANTSTYLSSRLLAESFEMSLRYGDEYMDENPITGYPGDFHLSTTGRKGRDRASVPPSTQGTLQSREKTLTPLTPEVKTIEVPGRKGSKSDKSPKPPGLPKPKRRKSKALSSASGVNPT
jgi:mediator of RNA polymerase II transcription subunit 6